MKEKILKWCENKKVIVSLSVLLVILSIFIARTSLASWELNLTQPGNNKLTIRSNNRIYDLIKSQSLGSDTSNNINYSKISSSTNGQGVYQTTRTDDNLEVYFYRGSVNNNNILFGGFCWKIVRTTERLGIKIIYNGTPSSDGSCNATGSNAAISESKWNDTVNDNALVGYMTGSVGATSYQEAHKNTSDSTIKNVLDTWYENNIKGTEAEKLIVDSVYCNDRTMENDWSNYKYNDWVDKTKITQLGYGSSNYTIFKGTSRTGTAVGETNPTLSCTQNNDKFTTKAKYGNGKLTYPIGLLTADEAVFAGSKGGILEDQTITNPNMYLSIGGDKSFWTMTPHRYYNNTIIYLAVNSTGLNTNEVATNTALVRPVITINGSAKITRGDGTASSPYQVGLLKEEEPSPSTSPSPSQTPVTTLPESWQDNGIFKDYYEQAYQKVQTMTLKEKIGQLMVIRHSSSIDDAITNYNVGGTTFYAVDFTGKTEVQVQSMTSSLQNKSKIPLITAVDEEGGKVVRVSSNSNLVAEPFKAPKELYDTGGLSLIASDTKTKSAILKNLGLNMNFAPVVDIADSTSYIYPRTLGQTPEITGNYAVTVVNASKGTGVSYSLKHFPGYGNNADTHGTSSTDETSLEELNNKHLVPFKMGIEAKAEAVMIAHNTVAAVDKENPASLSKPVHDILFNDLNFTGIAITDDLDMDAAKDIENKYTKAILAGNHIILCSNYSGAQTDILTSVNNGTITEEEITKRAFKVIAWKYSKGLFD